VQSLPEQEDLRRRLKAARAIRDLTVAQLAELIPPEAKLSAKTLYKLEGGETLITLPILRELSARLGIPLAWFTVPDLPTALDPDPSDADRVAKLEAEMAMMWRVVRDSGSGIRPVPPGG
jgi:transcriptional regulator with XRE-family HTH domain